jgi:hypothetical protein
LGHKWIANQRELRRLIAQMEQISRQAAELILSKTPKPEKHREISPLNTGTRTSKRPVTPGQRVLPLVRKGYLICINARLDRRVALQSSADRPARRGMALHRPRGQRAARGRGDRGPCW